MSLKICEFKRDFLKPNRIIFPIQEMLLIEAKNIFTENTFNIGSL